MKVTAAYAKLAQEMGGWYWLWKDAPPTADPEYIDFVRGEYQIAKMKLEEEKLRFAQARAEFLP